jgi:hypothetical protein
MADTPEYLNIQEASAALQVTRRRIWQMVKAGEIEAVPNPLDRREKLIPQSEIARLAPFVRPAKKARTAKLT